MTHSHLTSYRIKLAATAAMMTLGGAAVAGTMPPPMTEAPPVETGYEAGRGLLTLEGPSGMFINPTSATMPAGAFTAQACWLNPRLDDAINGFGALLSYGVTDWLEIGAIGAYVSIDGASDLDAAGSLARVRLLKDEGWIPQLSVGYYSRFGDDPEQTQTGFLAAYKRFPIGDESGFVKSLGVHAGGRYSDLEGGEVVVGYGGIEVQLPYRVYLVVEASTEDDDLGNDTPFAAGIQWRAGAVNISVAAVQNGNDAVFDDGLGFFFGIGSQLSF